MFPVFFGACLVIAGIAAAGRWLFRTVAADPSVLILPGVLAAVIAVVIIANKRLGRAGHPAPPPVPPPWPGAGYTPPPASPPAVATAAVRVRGRAQ